jgi:hypothetical protein
MFVAKGPRLPLALYHRNITNMRVFDMMYERVLSEFTSRLCLHQNLRALEMRECTIDEFLWNTLASLPQLEDLTLGNCDIVARDGVPMKLAAFKISHGPRYWRDKGPLQILLPEVVRMLHMHDEKENAPLMAAFGRAQFTHLVDLSINPLGEVGALFVFLKQCPHLESLVLRSNDLTLRNTLPQHIHCDLIPHLRNLTAPLDFVRLIAPGRPVANVTVLGWGPTSDFGISREELSTGLPDITLSSTPLLSLSVGTPSAMLLATIAELFPELQELSFETLKGSTTFNTLPQDPIIDERNPDLWDDEAFDAISAEDISDDEAEHACMVVRVNEPAPDFPVHSNFHVCQFRVNFTRLHSPAVQSTFNDICSGLVTLPRKLAVLRVRDKLLSSAPVEQQHQIIAAISRLYPTLRELRLGVELSPHGRSLGDSNIWERTGDRKWKRRGVDSCIKVHF